MNPPPPPRSRRRGPVLAVGALVVALGVGALAYVVMDRESPGAAGPPASSGRATTPSGEPSGTSSTSGASATPGSTSTPLSASPGRWHEVRSSDPPATYLVPPPRDGWTTAPSDTVAYVDARGTQLVRATTPSYYKAGFCPGGKGVARAWVGWTGSPVGVDETSRAAATTWVDAVSLRSDGVSHDPHTPLTSRPVAASGSLPAATVTTSTVTLSERDPQLCLPPQVEVSTATYRSPGGKPTTLVLVRDLGVTDQLSGELRDRILASARPIAEP